jgi:hypothetical protein
MEMALRRRLAGVVDVRISQEQQSAEVVLSGASAFSPSEFRAAVGEADVEVVHFEIEACGHFEPGPAGLWFVAGANRFAVPADASTPTAVRCLAARLDDRVEPGRLGPISSSSEPHE